jgi:SAM-dependent methyltransferase
VPGGELVSRRLFFARLLLCSAAALGQKHEYDFYPQFRNDFLPKLRVEKPGITNDEILERYAEKLKAERIRNSEIFRRLDLIRTRRNLFEADYWNRFYTDPNSRFNRTPNAFLVQTVERLPPGTALDYGMGEGRNSLYLAKLGWQVWRFDPADAAVAIAQKRAKELGLILHTAAVRDSEYEFGQNRFDLILFSWSMPLVPIQRIVDALKPDGIVVMECAADFAGRNGMLKLFDPLRILRYEIVREPADFYDRRETDIVRLIARNLMR